MVRGQCMSNIPRRMRFPFLDRASCTGAQHLSKPLPFSGCRDEENLEENEKIKQELNPRKIDEPKTPYLSPLDTDDEAEMELGERPRSSPTSFLPNSKNLSTKLF